MMNEEMLEAFVKGGTQWVQDQRAAFRPTALPLSASTKETLSSFFDQKILGIVRFAHTARLENPEFFATVTDRGQPPPLDFSQMDGITFIDTVVLSNTGWPPSEALFFHELVHVLQYCILGLQEFMRRYVHGWAENGFKYATIPLEVHAYELQAVFEDSPWAPFSVGSLRSLSARC